MFRCHSRCSNEVNSNEATQTTNMERIVATSVIFTGVLRSVPPPSSRRHGAGRGNCDRSVTLSEARVSILGPVTSPYTALLVGASAASMLARDLRRITFGVDASDGPERALQLLRLQAPDVVVGTLALGGMGLASFIRRVRGIVSLPVVVAAPHEGWLEALNVGADAPLFVPCPLESFNARVESAIGHHGVDLPRLAVRRVGRLTLYGRGNVVRVEPTLALSAVQQATLGALLDAGDADVDAETLEARWLEADREPYASVDAELEVLSALLTRASGRPALARSGSRWRFNAV